MGERRVGSHELTVKGGVEHYQSAGTVQELLQNRPQVGAWGGPYPQAPPLNPPLIGDNRVQNVDIIDCRVERGLFSVG